MTDRFEANYGTTQLNDADTPTYTQNTTPNPTPNPTND